MQIPINKDFEEAYRDEPVKGFTWKEAGCVLVSIITIVSITVLLYIKVGLSPDVGVFASIPIAFPILFLGFKKYQGLSAAAYLNEIYYEFQTKELAYEADELIDEPRVFTMERIKPKRERR